MPLVEVENEGKQSEDLDVEALGDPNIRTETSLDPKTSPSFDIDI
jgi:hypothetical protein